MSGGGAPAFVAMIAVTARAGVEEMRLVNLLCRLVQYAEEVR